MSTRIEFFWDVVSPYAYLASTQIDLLAEEFDAEVQWRPFLLGGVFKATGNSAPLNVKAKGKAMLTDLKRWATLYDVPMQFPKSFPSNSVSAMRAAIVADQAGLGQEFANALFTAHWERDQDIGQADVIAAAANKVGLDADKLAAEIQTAEIKQQLIDNTAEAVERGAFGTPTFFVGDDMFWGNDRLALLAEHLEQLS